LEYYEPGEGRQWKELYQAYREWRGEAEREQVFQGRLCFRLEPIAQQSDWFLLRFYWMMPTGHLLNRDQLGDERSLFLQALADAWDRFSTLHSLEASLPFHCKLSVEQAYLFLKETAPVLRREGYAVFAPQSMQ